MRVKTKTTKQALKPDGADGLRPVEGGLSTTVQQFLSAVAKPVPSVRPVTLSNMTLMVNDQTIPMPDLASVMMLINPDLAMDSLRLLLNAVKDDRRPSVRRTEAWKKMRP